MMLIREDETVAASRFNVDFAVLGRVAQAELSNNIETNAATITLRSRRFDFADRKFCFTYASW